MSSLLHQQSNPQNRYWDKYHKLNAVKILPGEYYVTKLNEVIVTVLGSCISVCIHDPFLNLGGMNHFMLTGESNNRVLSENARYGTFAMECLINDLIKMGANKNRLTAKVFGGAKVISAMNFFDVGEQNIRFVFEFIEREQIQLLAQDVGDICPRKVYFFPETGKVRVKKLLELKNDTIFKREKSYFDDIKNNKPDSTNDVELF